jgi:maltooligosyltrehalose trehalohydrolase
MHTDSETASSFSFGPLLQNDGCTFRLWARPDARIELVLEAHGPAPARSLPMTLQPNGIFTATVEGVGAGARYWFKIDGAGPYPDPASRLQPLGVHGPSQVVPPTAFDWKAKDFRLPELAQLVFYELHVGAFTAEGTFRAVIEKLDSLKQLGVNVMELMPIADFAGDRNWGYDGVSLYAPARCYGTSDDLRVLVDEAHRRGIAVCLDVVYNHLGPDGAYHSTFAPRFYSGKHHTPWGDGLNFDGEGREHVRNFFIESALYWVEEFNVDCLRADATHAILDDSKPHFLTELTERVHDAGRKLGRKVFIVAEDARNERRMVLAPAQGGHGFDAVWSDDFHHHMRRRLAGDCDGYFCDFDGATASIAKTVRDGWFFEGELSEFSQRPRGTKPDGLSHTSRVFNLQNHDQVGNRALGDRLSSNVPSAAYLAASALLLLSPELPLLFMGQEWAAAAPFQFFTDHNPELGKLVTAGRRKEFEGFKSFGEGATEEVPDPQDEQTFLRSKLDWSARHAPGHATCLRWYARLLQMRRHLIENSRFEKCEAIDDVAIALQWRSERGKLSLVVALEGPCKLQMPEWKGMETILSSEDTAYTTAPQTLLFDRDPGAIQFTRAGALVLATADMQAALQPEGSGTSGR